ncbi:ribosomal L1 domain-containing protein CG13096-like [Aricia agestis]|uniref:ribosomal L1 domain-containing protein CG13096-like n=1 Tax=Aricia agestis TaxID=91739 RepID=UPI001C207C8F|nr:ribosomal L1 domain-containing protein CG13096-like [Aricia agestis]
MLSINKSSKVIKKKKLNKEPLKSDKKLKKVSKQIITKDEESKIKIKAEAGNLTQIKKKTKYVLPSKFVTENLVSSCLSALQKLIENYNNKNVIFGDEIPIFMEIRSIKVQDKKGNIKFVLPHSTVSSNGEVCLITPDLKKGKKSDHEPSVDHWEELLRNAGVTSVKTVLPMRQLRVEYDQYELKRRLLTLHDFIMVDTRVLNHVSHLLGKIFFKKHNMLIPVKINEKGDVKKDIDTGLRTVMLRLSEGQTSTVLIGHSGMPQSDIKGNILALVKKLGERFPGGEANVRSLSIKLPLSLSLPLYVTLRSSNSILAPKIKSAKPKMYVDFMDELSTNPGCLVRVAPDGSVRLKKSDKKEDNSDIEDMEDEEVEEKVEDEE